MNTFMDKKPFYITTTLPYLNANPHIGFALEIIQADFIARYRSMQGYEVFFNTGTDEHGLKIYQKAIENNQTPKEYVDMFALRFKDLKQKLNLSYTHFIRTSDESHVKAAQQFWNICQQNGDIYKASYESKYCVGCELEKYDHEIEDGKCAFHPHMELQIINEENYFFKWSAYQEKLLEFYEKSPKFVVPEARFNEIKSFVARGINDFSVSRLKEKMPWGIPVPNDEHHVMYVWFDALVNYISTTGWPNSEGDFAKFWPGIQVAGKDNNRQQSAMWQAMLMSANLPTSKQIFIHGFITSGGQKMSKSLGNVIDPLQIINEFGTDSLRYYLLHQLPAYEDGDFTIDRLQEVYNTNLANGIGNLTSRILKMALSYDVSFENVFHNKTEIFDMLEASITSFNFYEAMDIIWKKITELDVFIQNEQPFKKIKINEEVAKKDVEFLLSSLYKIAYALAPALPETSAKIISLIETKTFPEISLFARKESK